MSIFDNKTQTATNIVAKPTHWRRRLWTLIILLILAGIAYTAFVLWFPYSNGDRTGVVRKLSEKGIAFKTWEGELLLPGASISPSDPTQTSNQTLGGTIWLFSVEKGDDAVVKALKEAEAKGSRVTLHYKQFLKQFDWRGETPYFITSVTEAPK